MTDARGGGRSILLIDDEADALDAYAQALASERYRVDAAARPTEALAKAQCRTYDAAVLDLKMPDMSGLEVLRALRKLDAELAVVVVTGYATIETAVEAMKEGASDYLTKPFTPDELRLALRRALERQELLRENRELRARLAASPSTAGMIGDSEAMREVRRLVARVAESDATVLIYGETGTGKELVARELHAESGRAGEPFITVDCAAVPAELLESEFFGHEKGAFTGAIRRRRGSFELAHGGTLFLDEIGNMGLDLQAKLLRALQEREIQPIGSERKVPVDVRLVAATNRNLREATRQGGFREDLYYRLNVIPISLPPLRARRDDIPALVDHFVARYASKLGKRMQGIDGEALKILLAYDWPGNVRELQSAVERAVTLADRDALDVDAFRHLVDVPGEPRRSGDLPSLGQVEKDYIIEVLQATRWNRKEASRILGISTVTLWRKLGGKPGEEVRA